jgi:hypothetical protein
MMMKPLIIIKDRRDYHPNGRIGADFSNDPNADTAPAPALAHAPVQSPGDPDVAKPSHLEPSFGRAVSVITGRMFRCA